MIDPHLAVAGILQEIEAALRELNLWHNNSPSAEALASSAPFAIDTLSFTQWLQFVFLPNMRQLVNSREPLPVNCAIAPMAQEYFRPQTIDAAALIRPLRKLDTQLS